MTPSQVSDRLDNWGRWLLDQHDCWPMGYPGACGSAEKIWRSPQCWDVPAPRLPIFERWAEQVEQAIHDSTFAPRWRYALKAEFVIWPAHRLMDNAINPSHWDDLRATAAAQSVRTYLDSIRRATSALSLILGDG